MLLSATSRNSRLATLPRIRLASAVSWIPGNSTTIRLAPWRCTRGSDTPNSLTRLRIVVRFCATAYSTTSSMVRSVTSANSCHVSPESTRSSNNSGYRSRTSARARSRASSVRKVIPTRRPSSDTRPRILSSRRRRLMPFSYCSSLRSVAASTSTSSLKCTPPLKSRPSFMGWAPPLTSQSGVVGARFNATIKPSPSARCSTDCALS